MMCFRKMKSAKGEGHPGGKGSRRREMRSMFWKQQERGQQGGKDIKTVMKVTGRVCEETGGGKGWGHRA